MIARLRLERADLRSTLGRTSYADFVCRKKRLFTLSRTRYDREGVADCREADPPKGLARGMAGLGSPQSLEEKTKHYLHRRHTLHGSMQLSFVTIVPRIVIERTPMAYGAGGTGPRCGDTWVYTQDSPHAFQSPKMWLLTLL